MDWYGGSVGHLKIGRASAVVVIAVVVIDIDLLGAADLDRVADNLRVDGKAAGLAGT